MDIFGASVVGLSFSVREFEAWYVPVPDKHEEALQVLSEFRELFMNPDILKVGQNVKFDILMLSKYGLKVEGPLFDTMLAHYLLQPEQRHNLNYLAETFLQYRPIR